PRGATGSAPAWRGRPRNAQRRTLRRARARRPALRSSHAGADRPRPEIERVRPAKSPPRRRWRGRRARFFRRRRRSRGGVAAPAVAVVRGDDLLDQHVTDDVLLVEGDETDPFDAVQDLERL